MSDSEPQKFKTEEEVLAKLKEMNPNFDPTKPYVLSPKTRMFLAIKARENARKRTSKKK
jgi:hypothetical protein